jgi:predicted RNA binding protein YcfA (HicA-like mRNA interferase family)
VSKREKLLEKLKNSPNNVTFAQVEKVLLQEGFILDRIASSHHIFRKGSVTFVIPVHQNQG